MPNTDDADKVGRMASFREFITNCCIVGGIQRLIHCAWAMHSTTTTHNRDSTGDTYGVVTKNACVGWRGLLNVSIQYAGIVLRVIVVRPK